MYLHENYDTAPELAGFLDVAQGVVNWGLNVAKTISQAVSSPRPSPSTPTSPAPAPAPTPPPAAAKAAGIGLPLIAGAGLLAFLLLRKRR